ncbi:MAG: TRAP transporter substrate-binding protein [Dehalobacterium sp.]
MRIKGNISFILIVILLMSVFVAGCSGKDAPNDNAANNDGEETKVLKLANYFGEDHPVNVALREKFVPMVEEQSNGTLKVEIYPNSQLGDEKAIYDGVRSGSIEMAVGGSHIASDIKKMEVPEWPYLFQSFAQAKKVLNGPIGDELTSEIESSYNIIPLSWGTNGFRAFSSNRPLKSMADFKGLRMRMPNIPHFMEVGEAMGMNVNPVPISEVFTALEQNVVDGQDNPIALLRSNGWYEVQSDVLESRHMFAYNLMIINKDVWESLSKNLQQVIRTAAVAYADSEWELMENSELTDKKFLEENGSAFITPDEKFLADMQQATEPLYEKHFADYPWAEELVNKIREETKK